MRSRVLLILAGIVGLLLFSTSARAHHGAASLYDVNKETTLKVTITEFVWTNPHVEVGIASVDDKRARWLLELGSPPNIGNRGWTSKTLKPGDVVELEVDGAKNTLQSVSIASTMEKEDAKGPVAAKVTYAAMADGTLYPAQQVLDLKAQSLKIDVENSGYSKKPS